MCGTIPRVLCPLISAETVPRQTFDRGRPFAVAACSVRVFCCEKNSDMLLALFFAFACVKQGNRFVVTVAARLMPEV